jgi:hypothetical protein
MILKYLVQQIECVLSVTHITVDRNQLEVTPAHVYRDNVVSVRMCVHVSGDLHVLWPCNSCATRGAFSLCGLGSHQGHHQTLPLGPAVGSVSLILSQVMFLKQSDILRLQLGSHMLSKVLPSCDVGDNNPNLPA